ncbi:MAG: S-methyl-5'-thioadenosine phosphorylase [Acidimicrobiales bacterium]
MEPIDVAVIGGSGFYELGGTTELVEVDTPWGQPSGPIAVGEHAGRRVAFLGRHGAGHRYPPHAVPNRANLWALRSIGVRSVVASFACGSLVPHLEPGTLVVPDQLIDRTTGRADTFHDTFADGPRHTSFAAPYDEGLRRTAVSAASEVGCPAHDGATVVVINGPRFATRAESRWYRSMAAELINMTQYPESVLAREVGMAYAAVGLVTDFDAGLDERPDVAPVDQDAVFERFARHLPELRAVVLAAAVSAP